MELDQNFASVVRSGITALRERSMLTRLILCTRSAWSSSNADAINYCLDHELFQDTVPDVARQVQRAIDCYGRKSTLDFLDSSIRVIEPD